MDWHMTYLRRPIISILVCCAVLCGIAGAQQRRKQKTPRAIALVEWPAKGKPVVVPIAILVNGRYYDADIYMADPVPMALEGGTVYEVQQGGDPIGFATVDGAMDRDGVWTGIAKFQTRQSVLAAERKKEKDVPSVRPDPVEGPPRLHKGAPKATEPPPPTTSPTDEKAESAPAPSDTQPTAKSDDDGRPTLRKPSEAPKDQPAPAPATQAKAAPANPPQDTQSDEDMSGRPRLRRGKPVQTNIESAPAPVFARTSTTSSTARNRDAQTAAPVRILPAISDATPTESRPFVMPGSETLRDQTKSGMTELARAALDKFAASHGGVHVGPLEKVDIRAFDLTLTNQATVVLTAAAHVAPPASAPVRRAASQRQPASPPPSPADSDLTYWVTIVARENYNGDMRQLAAWTTDSKHLDAYPRMELIDAIDADGDGRGELLFRAVNDLGRNFIISRVTADQVVPVYDSGALQR